MLLQALVSRERQTLLESDGLLAVINEKLLSSGQPISIPMFNTLFQVSNDPIIYSLVVQCFLPVDVLFVLAHVR